MNPEYPEPMIAECGARVWRFDFDAYMAIAEVPNNYCFSGDTLGVSKKESLRLARVGDASLVERAQNIVDAVQVDSQERPTKEWRADVVGSRVSVPAYLAGSPVAFRRRVRTSREAPHVSVYVCGCVSYSVNAEKMLRRNLAVLALVQELRANGVGVDVYVTADGTTYAGYLHCHAVKLPSPVDLATYAYVMAHPAFFRHTMHDVQGKLDGCQPNFSPCNSASEIARIRKAYGMLRSDVYVPFYSSGDALSRDPAAWVRARVQQALGQEADHV